MRPCWRAARAPSKQIAGADRGALKLPGHSPGLYRLDEILLQPVVRQFFARDAFNTVSPRLERHQEQSRGSNNMRVVIAHRFALVGQALIGLLTGRRPEQAFVQASAVTELDRLLRAGPADLLLIDLGLDGLGGTDGLRRLRQEHPSLRMVVLAETDDPSAILACLAAGVHGYVLQSGSMPQLLRALEIVEGGGVFAPASLATAPRAAALSRLTPANLTERQREVLRLLSVGRPTKSIARELGVAVGTVKVHLAAIYRALGATNRVEALVKAGGLPPLPAISGMLMRVAVPNGGALGRAL
jgi:DNA-binding NarL/FixJ family response regulator